MNHLPGGTRGGHINTRKDRTNGSNTIGKQHRKEKETNNEGGEKDSRASEPRGGDPHGYVTASELNKMCHPYLDCPSETFSNLQAREGPATADESNDVRNLRDTMRRRGRAIIALHTRGHWVTADLQPGQNFWIYDSAPSKNVQRDIVRFAARNGLPEPRFVRVHYQGRHSAECGFFTFLFVRLLAAGITIPSFPEGSRTPPCSLAELRHLYPEHKAMFVAGCRSMGITPRPTSVAAHINTTTTHVTTRRPARTPTRTSGGGRKPRAPTDGMPEKDLLDYEAKVTRFIDEMKTRLLQDAKASEAKASEAKAAEAAAEEDEADKPDSKEETYRGADDDGAILLSDLECPDVIRNAKQLSYAAMRDALDGSETGDIVRMVFRLPRSKRVYTWIGTVETSTGTGRGRQYTVAYTIAPGRALIADDGVTLATEMATLPIQKKAGAPIVIALEAAAARERRRTTDEAVAADEQS